ncbi:hypothetical protein [Arthrobacter sp. AL12]|uniref:hypothetical protein n=1 Tax=Arthrobacter sp. AL12 TaxID=3042241 RepID=UPI00249C5077|nr:hypothetical protein [Arthrobacter sp. AL12]MDI3211379.1 hypothetical protein [Arthrobacter sp. AL12]
MPGIGHLEVLPAGDGVELSATLGGAIRPQLQVLATLKLTELVLEEPDLEESVLELYGTIRGSENGGNGAGYRNGGNGASNRNGGRGVDIRRRREGHGG